MSDAPLHLVPVRSRQANDFVRTWHRHHPPPAGQIFAVGAADEAGILRAVAIVGRPVARPSTTAPPSKSPGPPATAPATPTPCCTGHRGARRKPSGTGA